MKRADNEPQPEEYSDWLIEKLLAHVGRPRADKMKDPEAFLKIALADVSRFYEVFQQPKSSGGQRTIEAPSDELKSLQRAFHDQSLKRASIDRAAFAFHPGRSAYRGLRRMGDQLLRQQGNKPLHAVYSTDIRDFFPSILQERAREEIYHYFFRTLHRMQSGPHLPLDVVEQFADIVSALCTNNGHLPQGPPTSPAIANMVASSFDRRIHALLDSSAVYGHYADDLVVMGIQTIPEEVRTEIRHILLQHGFKTSFQKTTYQECRNAYRIWGVDVLSPSKDNPRGIRFRIPRRQVDEWTRDMYRLIDEEEGTLPTTPEKFQKDTQVNRVLGRLSHAFNVARYGNDIPETSELLLPRKLAKAWSAFLRKFGDRLPESHQTLYHQFERTITVSYKEKPVEDVSDLDRRIKNFCTIRKDEGDPQFRRALIGATGLDGVLKDIQETKIRLLRDFPYGDQDTQTNQEGEAFYAVIAKKIDDLLLTYDDDYDIAEDDDMKLPQHVRELIVLQIATIELLLEKKFTVPRRQKSKTSLLPKTQERAWHRLRESLGARARHCKPLDRPLERVPEHAVETKRRYPSSRYDQMKGSYVRRKIKRSTPNTNSKPTTQYRPSYTAPPTIYKPTSYQPPPKPIAQKPQPKKKKPWWKLW